LTRRITGLLLGALITSACGQAPPGSSDVALDPGTVTFEPITWEAWQSKLAEYRGSVLVVDFWATWCVPCVERFPHMVEMYRTYGDRGVRFVSMSLDDRGDVAAVERAGEFLEEQRATFPNFLMDENVLEGFEKLELMTVPAVYVYAPDGTLFRKLTADHPDRQFTEEDIEAAIRELLG
jgi:thiol-disulfide isomerase/thioredoxin